MSNTTTHESLFDSRIRKLREAIEGKVHFHEGVPETGGSFYTALFGEDENFVDEIEDDDRDKKIFSSPERQRFKQETKKLPPAEMVCAFVKSIFEVKNLLHNVTPHWFKKRILHTKDAFDDLALLFNLIDGDSFDLTYTFYMMGEESRGEVGLFSDSMGVNFTLNSDTMTSMQRKLLNDILSHGKGKVTALTKNLFSTKNFLRVSIEPRPNNNRVIKYSHCVHKTYLNKSIDRLEIIRNLITVLFVDIQPENYFNNVYSHIMSKIEKLRFKRPKSGLFGRILEDMKDYEGLYCNVMKKRKEIGPVYMYH